MTEYENGLGLNWYIVSLVDREFVLGEVDRVNLKTRAEVAASEDAVEEDLKKARTVLYIVVVACALVPLVLTIVFVFRVTEPLMLLMTDMSFVATMNLEQVDPDRPLSLLSEINNMEKSFKTMLGNLLEYRQYLPQSVLITDTDEEDATSASADKPKISSKGSKGSHLSLSQRSYTESASAAAAANQRTVFDASVHTKNITLLVSNISQVHKVAAGKVGSVIAAYLEVLIASSKVHRGVVDDVCGDKVTVSFNALIHASNQKERGVNTALVIREKRNEEFKVNTAIACGPAVCGNMGCIGMKKFFMLGPVNTNVRRLERCGTSWNIPIVADGLVTKEVELSFTLRKLVAVRMKDGKCGVVSEIIKANEGGANEEWMYQLETQIERNEFSTENALLVKLYNEESASGVDTSKDYKNEVLSYYARTKTVPPVVDLFAKDLMVPE